VRDKVRPDGPATERYVTVSLDPHHPVVLKHM
jgi:hypothetical protein